MGIYWNTHDPLIEKDSYKSKQICAYVTNMSDLDLSISPHKVHRTDGLITLRDAGCKSNLLTFYLSLP